MTRAKVLERLAVEVMGVKRPPRYSEEANADEVLHAATVWYSDPANYPCIDVFSSAPPPMIRWKFGESAKPYRPFTDPVQALDLAEAYCRKTGQGYTYIRYWGGEHAVELGRGEFTVWGPYARNLADALTLAVCAAEGIKVRK